MLITGYFSVKLKWRAITNLYFLCIFYVSLSLIACSLADFDYKTFYWYKPFLLFHRVGVYWFMPAYIALILVSPLINQFLRSVTDRQLTHGMVLLFILNCIFCWVLQNGANSGGHNFVQLVFMYITGAWLNRCNASEKFTKRQLLVSYILCTLAVWGISFLLFSVGRQTHSFAQFDYNSPFVVMSAISLFLLFSKFNFRSALINRIAQSVIAIYLIQEGFFGKEVYQCMQQYMVSTDSFLIPSVIYVISIFAGAILIDQIRILLLSKPSRIVADWLSRKFPLESYF